MSTRAKRASTKHLSAAPESPIPLFPATRTELRLPRADGATIYLSGPDTVEMTHYFERVQEWFEHADLDASRYKTDDAPYDRSRREFEDFGRAAEFDDGLAPPADCLLGIDYPDMGKLPPPVVGDSFTTTGLVARRSVSSFVLARPEERFDTDTGVAVRHREGTVETEVEMREAPDDTSLVIPTSKTKRPNHLAIRSAASSLGGVHEDVFDICISNAITNKKNSNGRYEIDVDAIVRARGRGQKQKQEGPARYAAGFNPEMGENVALALIALSQIWVTQDLEPKLVKGKLVRDYDQVFAIKRQRREEKSGNLVSIEYELGSWFAEAQDHLYVAPRALLALDARNGGPVKALGRYFTQLAATVDQHGYMTRSIRDVIRTVRRSFDYGKNPQRLRAWLEDNLEELKSHGIITEWHYTPESDLERLPRKNWIDSWLELGIRVALPRRDLWGE